MATGTTAQQTIDVVTPAAGESVTEGTILEWHVKVGDFINLDDTIVEISTDKVDLELPSPASGTVTEILIEEGETVTVGQVIARIAAGDAPAPGAPAGDGGAGGAGEQPSTDEDPAPPAAAALGSATAGSDGLPDGVRISPVAARVAAVEGVNLANVSGSGPAGQIRKADVLSAGAGNGAARPMGAPATGAPANGKPSTAESQAGARQLRGGAAALARYMEQSLTIPTATSFRTLTVTMLDARRRELKGGPRKVSSTHLIAYAIARAGNDMSVMADHFAEIDGKAQRVGDGQVNLGLAVDVEKKDGSRTLMVPVIRDAGRLKFDRFLDAYDALVEKARTNTLTADDLTGANLTLTNPGGLGTVASVLSRRPGRHRRDDRRGEGHDDDLDV